MSESYLHREKQYLKINAELNNRFKDVEQIKNGSCNKTKQEVKNSRAQYQPSIKLTVENPKLSKIKYKITTNVTKLHQEKNSNPNVFCDGVHSSEVTEKPETITDSVCFNLPVNANIEKPLDHENDPLAFSNDKGCVALTNTTSSSPTKKTAKANISSEGNIKFLKSKVAILNQELELSRQENVKHIHTYERSIDSFKKQAAQIDHVNKENGILKIQMDKLKEANKLLECTLKDKEDGLAKLNTEIDFITKELKETYRIHNSLEKRFIKSKDDLEHVKRNLQNSQESERKLETANNQQRLFFEDQIKALCKQRSGLISAYKKQLLLVDNLKRQTICLEQSKFIQIAEKDFTKILDWNN